MEPRLEPAHSLVVYDAATGDVLHTHHFAAMPGAEIPPRAELHEVALRHAARRHGRELAGMAILEVDAAQLSGKASYRVALDGQPRLEQAG